VPGSHCSGTKSGFLKWAGLKWELLQIRCALYDENMGSYFLKIAVCKSLELDEYLVIVCSLVAVLIGSSYLVGRKRGSASSCDTGMSSADSSDRSSSGSGSCGASGSCAFASMLAGAIASASTLAGNFSSSFSFSFSFAAFGSLVFRSGFESGTAELATSSGFFPLGRAATNDIDVIESGSVSSSVQPDARSSESSARQGISKLLTVNPRSECG
jgi:hypothetical protein